MDPYLLEIGSAAKSEFIIASSVASTVAKKRAFMFEFFNSFLVKLNLSSVIAL